MKEGKLMGASILTAIAASLCCIVPVLALLAGTGSFASTFSWMAPARPYMIGVTATLLALAWYRKLKTKSTDECGCGVDEKRKFIQSKAFLGIITVLAIIMLAFPYYSHIFFPQSKRQAIVMDNAQLQAVSFKISGMHCKGCEEEVKHEVNKLNGIKKIEVSYENAVAEAQFDMNQTDVEQIKKAINSTGYKVVDIKLQK